MVVAVLLLAAVALALAVVVIVVGQQAGTQRQLADAAEARATERDAAAAAAAVAQDAAERAQTAAEERATAAETARAEADERARGAGEEAARAEERAAVADERASAAEADAEEARHQLETGAVAQRAAERRADETLQRATESARAGAAVVAAAPPAPGELDAQLVWALERARTERTWRQSVAVGPTGESVLASADDPLREALQIELDAAREEVGAVAELDVELPPGLTAAASVLVQRAAQELVAEVVRRSESTTLRVHADGDDVVVTVDAEDENGRPVLPGPLPLPPSSTIEPLPNGVRLRAVAAPTR